MKKLLMTLLLVCMVLPMASPPVYAGPHTEVEEYMVVLHGSLGGFDFEKRASIRAQSYSTVP